MSNRFVQETRVLNVTSNTITTATTTVIARFDVSLHETFAVHIQNNQTAIAIFGLQLQAAFDASENVGATAAPNWIRLTTANVPFPSTVEASAAAITSAIQNSYHWVRVVGGNSNTAIAGDIRVTIGGFRRSD